ncbi:ABC transporter substrate binding protein [Desulfotomaculum defluvii]
MKKVVIIFLIVISLITINYNGLTNLSLSYAKGGDNGLTPIASKEGTRWRVGYCESEEFITYSKTLVGIVNGLYEQGWITNLEGFDLVSKSNDAKKIWQWLATRDVSPYIEFVNDAFYNLKSSNNDTDIIKRLNMQNDLDLMVVMGTEAGVVLGNERHNTNIFVFASSNAVRAGIIDSVEDSGRDNVWAHMDINRFERQLNVFYDVIKFKKMGMVYEDSDIARVYSAVNEVEALAAEKGFEIVRYYVDEPRTPEDYQRYYQEVQEAYDKLANQVDAMFVTVASLESQKLPQLFTPFYEQQVAIFSQLGNVEVENGALMTVSVMDELNVGRFGADNIIKCLRGAKPRELTQTFQSAPRIAFNTKVAEKIGFKIPFELIMVTDEVYRKIPEREN